MSNHYEKVATTMGNHDHHDHDYEQLFDAAWDKSQSNVIIKSLNSDKKISQIIGNISGFKEAFSHKLDVLDCSDGRVRSGDKMGLAGVGILLDDKERQVFKNTLKQYREELGRSITITGHESCGAAGMAYPGPDSDHHGYKNAKEIAEETGNNYREVDHSEFISPIHNERALVIDATGRFNSSNWSDFPPHFISSAPFFKLGDGYLKKEVPALSGIALSDHGLGERFTPENPFYVIISANNEEELKRLSALAQESLKDYGDRMKIDGFIAPAKE